MPKQDAINPVAGSGSKSSSLLVGALIPLICGGVAFMALLSGAAVVIDAERVTPRISEEVLETRGIVTVPVQKVVQEGRIDLRVRRMILGLVAWENQKLEDVVDAGTSSGRVSIRGAGGKGASSYGTESLSIRTRAGAEWTSPSASGIFGGSPSQTAEEIRAFLDGNEPSRSWWWMPWLENLVGTPFALISLLFLLLLSRDALRRIGRLLMPRQG